MKARNIFDYFEEHKAIRALSLIALSVFLIFLVTTIHFSENINDFLPFGTRDRNNVSLYQNISGANRLFIVFSANDDVDRTTEAIDKYVSVLNDLDPEDWFKNITYQIDMETITTVSDFVYDNIPYFLTPSDIERMDSLLSDPSYVKSKLEADKKVLLFPSSTIVTKSISRDPLGLFTPVLSRLQASNGQQDFEINNGYIFTPDMSRAIVMLSSPFGNSETENNARLVSLLYEAASMIAEEYSDVTVDLLGGPVIAVENSERIRKDSINAIGLSVVLIILLLAFSFRSLKNIFLIFLSVGWGLLFALGGMAIFNDRVSVIVVGVSSVIIGLAVNYPLHLIAHTRHQPDRKTALAEIAKPLVVGNITTVGAFMALLPLKSPALRDLGLFASLLLVGTILFVLIYLPHYVSVGTTKEKNHSILGYLSSINLESRTGIIVGIILATGVLAFFSLNTTFDSNVANINYLTENQRKNLQYFEDLITRDSTHTAQSLYVYGSGPTYEKALSDAKQPNKIIDSLVNCGIVARQNEFSSFIVSKEEQQTRIDGWNSFVQRHRDDLTTELDKQSIKLGFSKNAFNEFEKTVEKAAALSPMEFDSFSTLTESLFSQNVTYLEDEHLSFAVDIVNVEPENMKDVKALLPDNCFDVEGMSSSLTSSLSNNFNYIGWACSLIVFIFLWFSFGRFELALISFLPMAVSWIWILGLMSLLGIKFNIVNIILATFIFGQGDDYTIFITEGCQYEFARRKPILKSYKTSILQSAIIMFVAIGTLIFAEHPALKSLAEVTIIGMFSVVLMAFIIPPFLFKILVYKKGKPRKYPLTIHYLFKGAPKNLEDIVLSRYIYKGSEIERSVKRSLEDNACGILDMKLDGISTFEFIEEGYGELSLLLALVNPNTRIIVRIFDEDRKAIAENAAEGLVGNIEYTGIYNDD